MSALGLSAMQATQLLASRAGQLVYAADASCPHAQRPKAAPYLYDVPLPAQVVSQDVSGRPCQLQAVWCQGGNRHDAGQAPTVAV